MTGEVEEVGHAPTDQRIDRLTGHLARPDRVAVVAVGHLYGRQGGRDQEVVAVEHTLHRVVHRGAHRLVAVQVDDTEPVAQLHTPHVLRRHRRPVLAEQIDPGRLQALDRAEVETGDHAAPQIGQLEVVVGDVEVDHVDGCPGSGERLHGIGDHGGNSRVDRVHTEVGAVRDARTAQVALQRFERMDRVAQAVGIARVVARQHIEHQRRIGHRARDRALGHERRGTAEGIRAQRCRHPAPRTLETVHPAPGRRDTDGTARIGSLGEGHQPVGHRRRAATRRAPGVARQIERIARRPEQRVVAGAAHAHHRTVGLADDDGTGPFHPLGEHAVGVDHLMAQCRHTTEGGGPPRCASSHSLHDGRARSTRRGRPTAPAATNHR